MNLTVNDIKSEVCQRCAACCRISINTEGNLRQKEFFEKIGYDVKVLNSRGGRIQMQVDLGDCKYLEKKDGLYHCSIYEARPRLCREFNCVAWALPNDGVESSALCKKATKIVKELQSKQDKV